MSYYNFEISLHELPAQHILHPKLSKLALINKCIYFFNLVTGDCDVDYDGDICSLRAFTPRQWQSEAHVCTEPPKGVPPHMPKHNDMKLIKMTVYNLTIEINYQVQCKYCDSDVRRCG